MATPRFFHRQSHRAGLPPGTFVRRPEAPETPTTRVVLAAYNAEKVHVAEVASASEAAAVQSDDVVNWVHVEGIDDMDAVAKFHAQFKLHPLLLGAIGNTGQRPRVENFGDHLYVVMRVLRPGPAAEMISDQISIVLGRGYVLSLVASPTQIFEPIRKRLEIAESTLRRAGADFLAYRIMDTVVDHYFEQLESVGDRLEALDERLLAGGGSQRMLNDVYRVKRQLIIMRKAVWPLRDVMHHMDRIESDLVHAETRPFLRDVSDHVTQIFDTLMIFRDMVGMMVDLHLNITSNRMNEVMKVLTIISTIFIPLSFLAGLYGMNFKHMPELGWSWAYFALLGVMALVAISMLAFFGRKGWLRVMDARESSQGRD